MNDLIAQMAKEISSQASRLDPVRLGLFLNWLCAHSPRVKADVERFPVHAAMPCRAEVEQRLSPVLKAWFASLTVQGVLWEYRLILDEIVWWCELDLYRLHMLLRSEMGGRDG